MFRFLSKLHWVELATTNDAEYHIRLIGELNKAKIPYREKVQYMGHGDRRGGQISALGENQQYINLYQIFVRADDIEQAKCVCRRY